MDLRGPALGIDIGTRKIAAVILDSAGSILAVASRPHQAAMIASPGCFEQDPKKLYSIAREVVCELPEPIRMQVRSVGLTGQMHGVLLVDDQNKPVSPLITWQDQRVLADGFFTALQDRLNHWIFVGYGCVTLAHLCAKQLLPPAAACGATIHAWLASRLCGMNRPVLDPTDAHSWGMMDGLLDDQWDCSEISLAGIPQDILPEIVSTGKQIGILTEKMAAEFGLPKDAAVFAAFGDNQASLFATLENPQTDLGLTLGTGGQLSAVIQLDKTIIKSLDQQHFEDRYQELTGRHPGKAKYRKVISESFEFRPYLGGKQRLAVSALLCGGSAWNWLAETVHQWMKDVGAAPIETGQLFARLNEMGLRSRSKALVRPHFLGERFDPELRGRMDGLDLNPLDLGSLARGVAIGIADSLRIMMPYPFRKKRKRIVASGNALRRNPLLVKAAEEVFGLPVVLSPWTEEAACGSAKIALGAPV
jgi:sugar (pentulose or hexulose) kinase